MSRSGRLVPDLLLANYAFRMLVPELHDNLGHSLRCRSNCRLSAKLCPAAYDAFSFVNQGFKPPQYCSLVPGSCHQLDAQQSRTRSPKATFWQGSNHAVWDECFRLCLPVPIVQSISACTLWECRVRLSKMDVQMSVPCGGRSSSSRICL